MLVIDKEQLVRQEQSKIEAFKNGIIDQLRPLFGELLDGIDEQTLVWCIDSGVDNAWQYGITTEWDIRRYLECAVVYGWGFDKNPDMAWVCSVLNDWSLDGKQKMDKIEQVLLPLRIVAVAS